MPATYRQLTLREAMHDLTSLRESGPSLAFDVETTGLDQRSDKLRLVNYQPFTGAGPTSEPVRIVDVKDATPGELDAYLRLLAQFRLAAHNTYFDLGWLLARGVFPQALCCCTSLWAKVTLAGEYGTAFQVFKATSLEKCAQFFLRRKLDKEEQTSEWSRPVLTDSQLQYAAEDVAILPPLVTALWSRLQGDGACRAALIESGALPCVAWLGVSGMPFRPDLWAIPFRTALERQNAVFAQLRRDHLTNARIVALDKGQMQFGFAMDSRADKILASPKQLLAFLHLLGLKPTLTGRTREGVVEKDSTADDALALLDHPIGALLREYREQDQVRKSFNDKWGRVKKTDSPPAVRLGRIFPQVHQCETETGRMSCKYPNLQQVPNPKKHALGRLFRQAFATPSGRELVIADFSQIELRLAAQISGDAAMRQVYLDGGDIHTEGARWVLGKDTPDAHDRQIMKSANFGLLYGAGVDRFRIYAKSQFGVDLGDAAGPIRERWFAAFPGIRQWHRDTGNRLDQHKVLTTRTLANRPRKLLKSYSECLNSPVQGSGADIVKLALARIYNDRHNAPVPPTGALTGDGWFPCAVIHDEIVLECPAGSGEAMRDWLRAHMIAAGNELMRDVPCDAEASVRCSWAE